MVKRIITGAHYGLRDWLMQRVTAVVMLVYTVVLLGFVVTHQPLGYEAWKGFFSNEAIRVLTLLVLLSLLLHAWVGVRDILMDYIQPVSVRLSLQVAVILALCTYALWSVSILWSA